MSNVCKKWYENYKKKHEQFIYLWNSDKEECCKKITGYDVGHCAWRYLKIHGAVDRMGGFANFSSYSNKSAESDYLHLEKLEKRIMEAEKILNKIENENYLSGGKFNKDMMKYKINYN